MCVLTHIYHHMIVVMIMIVVLKVSGVCMTSLEWGMSRVTGDTSISFTATACLLLWLCAVAVMCV